MGFRKERNQDVDLIGVILFNCRVGLQTPKTQSLESNRKKILEESKN